MSELDLTEAFVAADKAWREAYFDGAPTRNLREIAVTAAAPLIEKAVREQVAREIGFQRGDRVEATENPNEPYGRGILFGLALAARIARGGAR